MISKKESHIKKKILLVGGTGYIGNKLYEYLKKNYSVVCFGKVYRKKKNYYKCDITKKYFFNAIKNINQNFDFVINLTGQINNNKKLMSKTILQGNKNLIKFFQKKKTLIIYLSTSLVYKSSKNLINEKSKLMPNNFYASKKLVAESLYKKSEANYIILRLGNVYDDKLKNKGFIFNINKTLKNGRTLNLLNLQSSRSYIHLDDLCRAIKNILEKKLKFNNIYNLANESISNLDMIALYEKKFKKDIKINNLNYSLKYDPILRINSNKFKKYFKFNFKYNFKKTLKKINEIK